MLVLFMLLQMFSQLINLFRQKSRLHFGRTAVRLVLTRLLDDGLFFLRREHMR